MDHNDSNNYNSSGGVDNKQSAFNPDGSINETKFNTDNIMNNNTYATNNSAADASQYTNMGNTNQNIYGGNVNQGPYVGDPNQNIYGGNVNQGPYMGDPNQNIYGGNPNQGPYMGDTNQYTYGGASVASPVIENNKRGKGVIGALLGALVGGILWTLIGCLGYVSGWIAVAIFTLAQFGYKKLSGKSDKFGIIISLIFGLLIIIPATYVSYGFSLFQELNTMGSFSLFEVLGDMPFYMERYDLWPNFFATLGQGYLFSVIGALIVGFVSFGGNKRVRR